MDKVIWGFIAFWILVLLGIIVLAVMSYNWQKTADCSEFKNLTIQSLPVRCLKEYKK